jgi:hypothetical protein
VPETFAPILIVTFGGETRKPLHVYPNGSYRCPYCGAAVLLDEDQHDREAEVQEGTDWRYSFSKEMSRAYHEKKCHNPACIASIYATAESIAQTREVWAKRAREEQQWKDRSDAMERRRVEEKAQEEKRKAELIAEAHEHGYCPACILGYHHKRIRHRKLENCPEVQKYSRRYG